MSVTALKATHAEPRVHAPEKSVAVRTEEDRRVKEAANLDKKATEPVRPPAPSAATSSSGVRDALVSLKKGG